jgi:dTDP-4-dehydrorhamnose reductase
MVATAQGRPDRLMRWLVVGSRGQLGTDLMSVLGADAVGLDFPEIDITDPASVRSALEGAQPEVVVNAAAYTAVDAAEAEEDTALEVNGRGPAVLAEAVAELGDTRLLHISTDYVFAGDADRPYSEDHAPAPRSAYGRTKLAGEDAVLESLPDRSWVVRTAWLYGEHGQNFVKTMLGLESTHETVSVVDDQVGQPTWSMDLARQIQQLVQAQAPPGIYHGTNSGSCSWFEFTRLIFQLVGADPERVRPTTTDAFPRPAPRPAYSVLGHDAWAAAGLSPMRDWREAAQEAVPRIADRVRTSDL